MIVAASLALVPINFAVSLTVRSVVVLTVGGVYVTLEPVVLESVPTALSSCQLTVPVPFNVAKNAWVEPFAARVTVFGEIANVVAGGVIGGLLHPTTNRTEPRRSVDQGFNGMGTPEKNRRLGCSSDCVQIQGVTVDVLLESTE